MQLEGSLEQFPLAELLTMIVGSSVTGVLHINIHGTTGNIFYKDGHPYHATAGALSGFDAVCCLFEQQQGTFCFTAGAITDEESLHMDPWSLIEQAEREARLWITIRPHVPSLEWIPQLQSNQEAQIQISEEVWPLLAAIDGQRTVSDIAAHLGQIPVEVAALLCTLKERGLVTINAPRRISAPLDTSAARPQIGFLERLMSKTTEQA